MEGRGVDVEFQAGGPVTPMAHSTYPPLSERQWSEAAWPWLITMAVYGLLFSMLWGCRAEPDPRVEELERRMAIAFEAQKEHLSLTEKVLAEQTDLQRQISDARVLSVIGGPRRRFLNGIGCDGSAYLPESYGAQGHRALMKTGLCDPLERLPTPEPEARTVPVLH